MLHSTSVANNVRRLRPQGLWAGLLLFAFGSGQATVRAAEPALPPVLLQMVRDPAVHRELKLSSEQVARVLAATDRVDPEWWPSRILPPEKQQPLIARLTEQLRSDLSSILSSSQQRRIEQLELQAHGARMLLRDDVAETLQLSEASRETMRRIALETDQIVRELQRELMNGGDAAAINRQQTQRSKQEHAEILGELTPSQKQQLARLIGDPFDFSQVKRTLPRAPELIGEAEDWLQGGPHRLEQLRGKVVVIHFYAFQCINCRRNLPHYAGWFDDFPSDEVVIIGIQTPETSAERDPARVRRAIADDGIDYPVLFDGENQNWRAWGNTMWPTVYLIDKEGFIHTWWQGELNWQGAQGEQSIRQKIRNLLRE